MNSPRPGSPADAPTVDTAPHCSGESGTRRLSALQQQAWRNWIRIHALSRAAIARQLAADAGLSLPDYEVLVCLSEAAEQRERIAVIADVLQWDRSRLSHQLTRMAKRDLVRREACEDDGRGAFAAITPTGLQAIEQAAPQHAEHVLELFFDRLDPAETEAFAAVLRKLAGAYPGM